MITFVYKTGFEDKKNGDDFKPPRRNSKAKKLLSLPKNEEDKLSQLSSDEACRDGPQRTQLLRTLQKVLSLVKTKRRKQGWNTE